MFTVIKCPECGSKKVEIKSVNADPTQPFDTFEFACKECDHWWFDRNDGGKGAF